jgi:hypothetical protein
VIFGSKEDRGGKDSLKSLNDSTVMESVFGKMEEVEHLSGAVEMDLAILLSESERCHPDGNQPVLTVREAEAGMGRDLEGEAAVAPRMNRLIRRRPAERYATKDEGSGVVSEFLLALVPLLTDELDRLQVLQPSLRDRDRRKQRGDGNEAARGELGRRRV